MNTYDPRAKCEKCGHDDISSQWHPKGERVREPNSNSCYTHELENEVIARYCRRCQFAWHEKVRDAHQTPAISGANVLFKSVDVPGSDLPALKCEMRILRSNLTAALRIAIGTQWKHERTECGYFTPSCFVRGLENVMEALNAGMEVVIADN